jgi:hypothetical protein
MRRRRTKESEEHARKLSGSGTSIDEKTGRLFEPDVLAAEEYRGAQRRSALPAELELMAAVLEQGIADYRRYASARDNKRRGLFRDAEAWLADGDQDWVFSFTSCCDALGIDPSCLRRRLARPQSTEKVFSAAA